MPCHCTEERGERLHPTYCLQDRANIASKTVRIIIASKFLFLMKHMHGSFDGKWPFLRARLEV